MERSPDPLIAQATIAAAVQRLAQEIDRDYEGRSPLLLGILKGSFIFLADLVRAMQVPIRDVEFMRFSSYGSSTTSSGQAQMQMGIAAEAIVNQDVIVVEDIIDTGITTTAALEMLRQYHPASLKLCALLDKPARRRQPVQIDYLGFTIPDRFIVGYGIDFNQQYRQLPAIYELDE
jgi:hypoxanthine phosphoribosyltransferase